MLKSTQSARPTFDPARGKELPKGPAYHQRLLPAHTKLKTRQPGQGGDADREIRDLRAELLAAEATARAKAKGGLPSSSSTHSLPASEAPSSNKRLIGETGDNDGAPEDEEAKRRKILEETRDIDADSDGGGGGDSDSSSEDDSDSDDDEEDETAELLRELEKIKRERAEQREKEVRLFVCCFPVGYATDTTVLRSAKSKRRNRPRRSLT